MQKTNTNFFFIREENDSQIIYKFKHTKTIFLFAWCGIIGMGCWLFGNKNISKFGLYMFIVSGSFLLRRWIYFFRANIEMLNAKRTKNLIVEGNKFSREPKAIINKKR